MNFSEDQLRALYKFTKGQNLFLTGPAGTGKSFLIQTMTSYATNKRKVIQVCALTGVAAVLLGNQARTIHSWSGIKICRDPPETTARKVAREQKYLQNWQQTDILVIDEVSMMSAHVFDTLDKVGRLTRNRNLPFGGIQVIMVGDMFQLPPVGNDSTFCFQSPQWFQTVPIENHIELRTLFRQTDPEYIEALNQVREGRLEQKYCDVLRQHVQVPPPDLVVTRLYPRRDQVDYLNHLEFNRLTEPVHEFPVHSTTKLKFFVESGKPITAFHIENKVRDKEQEVENMRVNTRVEPLKLRVGAHVMCTVNLDQSVGIVNGSQGKIIGWTERQKVRVLEQYVEMELPRVQFKNHTMTIQPKAWQSTNDPKIAIAQLPLTLCWALTIHKSQGATLDNAVMDLGSSVFEYGQAYVALSRVRSLEGLFLTQFEPQRIRAHPEVVSFYRQIRAHPIDNIPPVGIPELFQALPVADAVYSEPIPLATVETLPDPDIKVVHINKI